jgi:hypothetical protein
MAGLVSYGSSDEEEVYEESAKLEVSSASTSSIGYPSERTDSRQK